MATIPQPKDLTSFNMKRVLNIIDEVAQGFSNGKIFKEESPFDGVFALELESIATEDELKYTTEQFKGKGWECAYFKTHYSDLGNPVSLTLYLSEEALTRQEKNLIDQSFN